MGGSYGVVVRLNTSYKQIWRWSTGTESGGYPNRDPYLSDFKVFCAWEDSLGIFYTIHQFFKKASTYFITIDTAGSLLEKNEFGFEAYDNNVALFNDQMIMHNYNSVAKTSNLFDDLRCSFKDFYLNKRPIYINKHAKDTLIPDNAVSININSFQDTLSLINIMWRDTCYNMVGRREQIRENHSLRIYPNPVKYTLYIKIPIELKSSTIEVFTLLGKKQLYEVITSQTHTVNMQNLEKGIYLLRIKHNDRIIINRKIIKL